MKKKLLKKILIIAGTAIISTAIVASILIAVLWGNKISSVMSIKMLVDANEEEALIRELEINGFSQGKISIGHCANENGALQLKEMIREIFPEAEIEIHKFRGLCSFYAEKGGILLGYEKK